MPTIDHQWNKVRVGKFTSYVLPGDYNMLAVVTGRKLHWTWRIVDRDTGITISQAARDEQHGQSRAARSMARLVMDSYARRWQNNLRETTQHLEDTLEFKRLPALERESMKKDLEFLRALMRHTMIVERGGPKHATCDLCGQPPDYMGLQLHELLQRGMTVNNPDARELSYVPELTALLCENCHSRAHNPETRDKLFRVNMRRYGRLQVELALDRFRRAFEQRNTLLTIRLPDETVPERSENKGNIKARK